LVRLRSRIIVFIDRSRIYDISEICVTLTRSSPDETGIPNFHHLPERHEPRGAMPDAVNLSLDSRRIGQARWWTSLSGEKPGPGQGAGQDRAPFLHPEAPFGFVKARFPGLHAQPAQTDSVRYQNCRLLRPTFRSHISLAEIRRNIHLLPHIEIKCPDCPRHSQTSCRFP
jgi:hypothetical protein